MSKPTDRQYVERLITVVKEVPVGWNLQLNDGFDLNLTRLQTPQAPTVGQKIRIYGRLDQPYRGIDLDGQTIFYRTEEEQKAYILSLLEKHKVQRRAQFEKDNANLDAKYDSLPDVFKRRLDKFRGNNPDFRWEYEDYEMTCCLSAVKVADAMIKRYAEVYSRPFTPTGDEVTNRQLGDLILEFIRSSCELQLIVIPDLHSGHTAFSFNFACKLAFHYLVNPEQVVQLHGALAPIVGSKDYGCVPRIKSSQSA